MSHTPREHIPSSSSEPQKGRPTTPQASPDGSVSRRALMRPVELLAIAGGIAIFIGGIVLFATRNFTLALIFGGVAFIAALVVTAMMLMAVKPGDFEADESGLPVLQRHELEKEQRKAAKAAKREPGQGSRG